MVRPRLIARVIYLIFIVDIFPASLSTVFHAQAIELCYDHVHSNASVSFPAAESCAALTDVDPGLYMLPDTVTEAFLAGADQ